MGSDELFTGGGTVEDLTIHNSEDLLKSFAANSNDVIWITHAHEYRLIYVSPSFEKVWGRDASEIYADLSRFIEYVHPDDRERVQISWQNCVQGSVSQMYRVVRPDGAVVWIHDRGFPIYSDRGELLYLGGIAEEVTHRKQAESVLLQREAELQLVTDAVPALIAFIDSEQRYRFHNRAYEEWFGHPTEKISGKHLQEVLGETAYEGIRPYVEQVLAGQTVTFERQVPYRDGGTRFVSAVYVPRFNDQGIVEGFVGLVTDMSERMQIEAALRESEDRLRLALDSAKLGTWDFNPKTRALKWDARCKEMFGLSADAEVTWEGTTNAIYWEDRERVMVAAQWALNPESGGNYDVEYRTIGIEDGVERWLTAKGKAFFDEACEPVRFIGTVLDITEKKQADAEREQSLQREQAARAEAEAANQVKDEFLAVLSHELRSPLNPIVGWARLLQTGRVDEATTKQALSVIERNAKLQSELIEDLLDVSRILSGKLNLNITPVNIVSIINAAIETIRLTAESKAVEVKSEFLKIKNPTLEETPTSPLDSSPVMVSGDTTRLQQVIWNLLSNAVKFTPPGGCVEVQLHLVNEESSSPVCPLSSPSYAQITVSDTGRGIAPEFLPHIFDYFHQADSATTRRFGGLGLGLAIAHHLVELHGGTIQAASPGDNLGATFIVKLPLMTVQKGEDSDDMNSLLSNSTPSQPLSGLQILIVDDDIDTRDFITFLLERSGGEVTSAATADEALEALAEIRPDVLLSDVGMPDTDGYMLVRQVRTLPPDQGGKVPAIALTAYAGDLNRQQALSAGFQLHLSKPVEPEKLVDAIVGLVQHNSHRR